MFDAHFHPLDLSPSLQPSSWPGLGAPSLERPWSQLRRWAQESGSPYLVGFHPWQAPYWGQAANLSLALNSLEEALSWRPAPWGIGEIGLDRSPAHLGSSGAQLSLFKAQYRLAQRYALPCLFHCVRAYTELLAALKELWREAPPAPLHLCHAFNSSPALALDLVKRGFYLTLSPRWLERNGRSEAGVKRLRAWAQVIPAQRLLLESDSPWGGDSPLILEEQARLITPYWGIEPAAWPSIQAQKAAFLGMSSPSSDKFAN